MTTPDPSGSPDAGPMTDRSAAGKPFTCNAAHISGSQETTTPRLTCAATQVAACCLPAAAAASTAPSCAATVLWSVPADGADAPSARVNASTAKPAARTATEHVTTPTPQSHRRAPPRPPPPPPRPPPPPPPPPPTPPPPP